MHYRAIVDNFLVSVELKLVDVYQGHTHFLFDHPNNYDALL